MWVDEWLHNQCWKMVNKEPTLSSSIRETDYFSITGKKIVLAPAVVVVLVHVGVFVVPESEFVSLF